MGEAFSSIVTRVSYIPSIMFRAAADAVKCGSSVFVPAGWATIRSPPFFWASAGVSSARVSPRPIAPIASDPRSVFIGSSLSLVDLGRRDTTAWHEKPSPSEHTGQSAGSVRCIGTAGKPLPIQPTAAPCQPETSPYAKSPPSRRSQVAGPLVV